MSIQTFTQRVVYASNPGHQAVPIAIATSETFWLDGKPITDGWHHHPKAVAVATCSICGQSVVANGIDADWAHGDLAVGGQVATPDGTTVPHADGPVTPEQEYSSQVRYCDVCESVEPGEIGEFVWPEAGDAHCPGGGAASGWTCGTCETVYECEGEIDWSL